MASKATACNSTMPLKGQRSKHACMTAAANRNGSRGSGHLGDGLTRGKHEAGKIQACNDRDLFITLEALPGKKATLEFMGGTYLCYSLAGAGH